MVTTYNNINYEFHNSDRIMELFLFIESNDDNLKNMYNGAATFHNAKMHNSDFPDAGFDLFCPFDMNCDFTSINKVDFSVCTSARIICENGKIFNSGFYLHPRSSLSGTPLRLANSTGIIDSGYRGHLVGKFDCLKNNYNNYNNYVVNRYDKLLQIVAPGMIPIFVYIVDNKEELGLETDRGAGGFGSTGK